MLSHRFPLLFSLALASCLFACTTGTTTTTSGNPSPKSSSSSPTDPAPKKDGGSSSTDTGGDLGPECTAYIACCDELAASMPQLAASCDSVKTQIENAQSSGVSTAAYESSCKSGVASFKSAGYCD